MGDSKSWDGVLKPLAGSADPDGDCLSLGQMDGKYSTMRPANKTLERLHVIDVKGDVVTLIYAYLDVRADFKPGRFVVTFSGSKHWELTVEGNNLWRMFDYITSRRWPYIRIEPRGKFEDKQEIVTAADIKDVTPALE